MKTLILNTFLYLAVRASSICLKIPSWTSERGQILFHGEPFALRGTNYFGLETTGALWNLLDGSSGYSRIGSTTPSTELGKVLDVVRDQGFNAIRLPISADRCRALESSFDRGHSIGSIVQAVLDGAADRGIVVLLDMHRLTPCCSAGQTWFGYENWLPFDEWVSSWMALLGRFGDHPAVFAIDLFNEPHGSSNWGLGGDLDWHRAVTNLIGAILEERPQFKGLFFVEGTSGNSAPSPHANAYPYFWGEFFDGVYDKPVLPNLNRVVYSPHVYGPSVFMQSYFQDANFPENMDHIWDVHFGWVAERTGRAVIVGEWGGTLRGSDAVWQSHFAEYLRARGIGSFYWTLNPGSSDTGGWVLPGGSLALNEAKLAVIRTAHPKPTRFVGSLKDGYCLKAQGVPTPPTPKLCRCPCTVCPPGRCYKPCSCASSVALPPWNVTRFS